ncbi:hypothetical protein PLICRDRAFT_93150, partial [Plicaturopsis crispa FD-325 SS-3]
PFPRECNIDFVFAILLCDLVFLHSSLLLATFCPISYQSHSDIGSGVGPYLRTALCLINRGRGGCLPRSVCFNP